MRASNSVFGGSQIEEECRLRATLPACRRDTGAERLVSQLDVHAAELSEGEPLERGQHALVLESFVEVEADEGCRPAGERAAEDANAEAAKEESAEEADWALTVEQARDDRVTSLRLGEELEPFPRLPEHAIGERVERCPSRSPRRRDVQAAAFRITLTRSRKRVIHCCGARSLFDPPRRRGRRRPGQLRFFRPGRRPLQAHPECVCGPPRRDRRRRARALPCDRPDDRRAAPPAHLRRRRLVGARGGCAGAGPPRLARTLLRYDRRARHAGVPAALRPGAARRRGPPRRKPRALPPPLDALGPGRTARGAAAKQGDPRGGAGRAGLDTRRSRWLLLGSSRGSSGGGGVLASLHFRAVASPAQARRAHALRPLRSRRRLPGGGDGCALPALEPADLAQAGGLDGAQVGAEGARPGLRARARGRLRAQGDR